jgi:guanylate kinase
MNNLLVVISGPSGGGKGTIINKLLSRNDPEYERVSTFTTRPRRNNEEDGQYRFISNEEYEYLDSKGLLIAKNIVDGYYYRGSFN